MSSEMKKCRKCKQIKPISEFYFRKRCTKTRHHICKECDRSEKKFLYERTAIQRKQYNEACRIIGGWKCYVMNHVKNGEFKFNIVTTTGDVFKSNDEYEFKQKIKELLCQK